MTTTDTVSARASYEVTPGVKPFVEVGATPEGTIGGRFLGLPAQCHGVYVKVGSTFEFARLLTGEIAVGWL